MSFLMCLQRKNKVKVLNMGNAIETMTMTMAICKTIADKIADERKLTKEDALEFLIESITESYNSLTEI